MIIQETRHLSTKSILTKRSLILFFLTLTLLPSNSYASVQVYTPEKILPTGIDSSLSVNPYTGESGQVRKGTIAATINNVALLNKLLNQGNQEGIEEVVKAVRVLIPSLKAIGIFNMFSPMEWLSTTDQLGRILVAVLLLQAYPAEITTEIKAKLAQIREQTPISYLAQEIDKVL